jgi:hypothetical protein
VLKLELVRFSFSPVVTFGVMHARDGWACFTGESPYSPTNPMMPSKHCLIEGIYQMREAHIRPDATRIDVYGDHSALPVTIVSREEKVALVGGTIAIGMGLDMAAGTLSGMWEAHQRLRELMKGEEWVYVSIRHLDNTLLTYLDSISPVRR